MRTGADPEQLDQLARTMAGHAAAIDRHLADLGAATHSAVWRGADRDHFVREVEELRTSTLVAVGGTLRDAARELGRQAADQRRASADWPEPSGTTGAARLLAPPSHAPPSLSEVVGDLTTATSVVVIVPGIGSDAGNFDAVVADAGALVAAASAQGHRNDVAVIAWLGYDAPRGFDEPVHLGEALGTEHADAGAEALRRFVDGLAVRPDADITLVGHSYGSLVVAGAARDNGVIDRVVVLGSPGLGVDHVADLGLVPGVQFFAMSTQGDLVSHSQWFGLDPTLPAFGARTLDGDAWPGTAVDRAHAHSSYFDEGSQMLDNLALAVTGQAVRLEPRSRLPWADSPMRVTDLPFARPVWGVIDLIADELRG